jgi:hypothetical protein
MLAVDEKYRKRKIGKILKSLLIACNTYIFWIVVKYWNSSYDIRMFRIKTNFAKNLIKFCVFRFKSGFESNPSHGCRWCRWGMLCNTAYSVVSKASVFSSMKFHWWHVPIHFKNALYSTSLEDASLLNFLFLGTSLHSLLWQ